MGILVALEGVDGSGKGTQAQLLQNRLVYEGFTSVLYSFPRYSSSFFGREIGRYLNGEFGSLKNVHPKLASLLYAGDRFEARDSLIRDKDHVDVIICDRYTPSSKAHQAAKLPENEWEFFFSWVEYVEHDIFKLPRADVVVYLDMPPSRSTELVKRKAARTYTTNSEDMHESDYSYISTVYDAYRDLSRTAGWIPISCVDDDDVLSVEDIHGIIWLSLSAYLW